MISFELYSIAPKQDNEDDKAQLATSSCRAGIEIDSGVAFNNLIKVPTSSYATCQDWELHAVSSTWTRLSADLPKIPQTKN